MVDELAHAIESVLFATERPLTVEELKEVFADEVSARDLEERLRQLKAEYESAGRGFRLSEIAGGWQFVSHPRFESYLKKFFQSRLKKKLTQAALETLSIVAYRQPVTRADIEFVRGVDADAAIKSLVEKGMVRVVGKKDVPGRPLLYGTTREFLERFGLKSLEDLPALSEFTEKDVDARLLPPELKQAAQSPNGSEPAAETENSP